MAPILSIRIQHELKAKLEGLARLNGQTLSQFTRHLLTKETGLPAKNAAAPKKEGGGK
jgi:predicted DNA-binding protein